ncbi:CBS domain-containing protein [Sulfolobus acidocaldarius]|uniref:Conserved Archaeal protein n=3 Tax=Sulfolobus acidocaldarius TaxID=2285 RepID=Q4JCK5_SULAC|nr:CBS domain-containing protein [Sulfolobus acidocaldarius]AAY79474.1 conserved Archaeal protein [Sulfolobus acidocaldarius DSM 639]AGE70023.1 hypothetical protein SacN8_00210 [Sulfolobus acidocaldarius N8]ALU29550.1 hypothetical protein ATY89_06045 [Sulfolobus acidocaldarius]ALU32280.1 hypothetical protein ATZ20_09070 [Sulfolobus acidocaldarius]WCM34054.1 CBS domain-containing protein [Sulfolobus acidocaldarius DSM 639]
MQTQFNFILNKTVHVIREDDSVRFAAEEMKKHNIGSLIVIDNRGKVSGIITERDLVRAIAEGNINSTVSNYMTRNVIGVTENFDPNQALQVMLDHGFRHLPIIGKDGRVKGILSIRDLARTLIDPHYLTYGKEPEEVRGTGIACPVCGVEIDEYGYCGCGSGSG